MIFVCSEVATKRPVTELIDGFIPSTKKAPNSGFEVGRNMSRILDGILSNYDLYTRPTDGRLTTFHCTMK